MKEALLWDRVSVSLCCSLSWSRGKKSNAWCTVTARKAAWHFTCKCECRPSGPASGSSESLSLLTCPTGNDVTGLYPSGQGRSQQKRADVAAVLQGWLEADASSVDLQQT